MGQLQNRLFSHSSHAYVLEGEAAERLALAREYAKGLNCLDNNGPRDACGHCLSCRVFESGNHPDIFFVTGTKATGIGVEDVRSQIVEEMTTSPFKYRYKIFFIDKAETLTPAAQNALLKTIEEPAAYGVFLFLAAHVHTLLPTVLSRCVTIKLGEKLVTSEHEALAEEIAGSIPGKDILETMALYKRFEPYKESRESMGQLLDMLYLSYGKRISKAGERNETPEKLWFDSIDTVRHTKQVLTQNGNFQLAVELMLLKLSGAKEKL
ncbi:MAG: hypothetical protein FWC73_12525 [Defluviitaleaceae bacterium]|nr:hypothetical protein [Defluviitaleaceae bacterium]